MMLSGRLADWSVADLLQILRITEKTASLEIDGDERGGVLFFRSGRIVDAELKRGGVAADPRDRIVEAVYVLQLLEEGSFRIGTRTSPEHDFEMEASDALAAASSHLDAERQLRSSGLLDARALRIAREVGEPITLAPEHWAVIAELTSTFTFGDLEDRIGRRRAVEGVGLFRRLGVLEAAFDGGALSAPVESGPPTPVPDAKTDDSNGTAVSGDGSGAFTDDEARFLAEAATAADVGIENDPERGDEDAEARRRAMKSVISPADTTLVPGVLSDIRERFRTIEGGR